MLKTAFGNNAMKKTVLFKWYSKFEQGDNYVAWPPLINLNKEN